MFPLSKARVDATGPTLKTSGWYKWRSAITAVSITACWIAAGLSQPRVTESSLADLEFDVLALLAFTGGGVLRVWATLYIGGRKGEGVVDQGPYSVCRNPLYLGTLLLIISQAFLLKSLVFSAGLMVPILVYVLGVVPAEEGYLLSKIGAPYRDYLQHVPRWWPRWSLFHTSPVLQVEVQGLLRECRRILGWATLMGLAEVLCLLRAQPWWPHFSGF